MHKKINIAMKNVSIVLDEERGIRLVLPNGINEENYISYIKSLLDFVELNGLTVYKAKKLFQDAMDMLGYHPCTFSDTETLTFTKVEKKDTTILQYSMYKNHNLSSVEFITKYKLYSAPFNLSQEIYFEMLLQLDDFIKEKGLTINQAQNLFSDCIEMLLQSK